MIDSLLALKEKADRSTILEELRLRRQEGNNDSDKLMTRYALLTLRTFVVTDSDGIQEETTILGIPCVTVRETTERSVTVESGTNTVGGTNTDTIKDAIRHQLGRKITVRAPLHWDGQAAERIIDTLLRTHYGRASFLQSATPATTTHDRSSLSHPSGR